MMTSKQQTMIIKGFVAILILLLVTGFAVNSHQDGTDGSFQWLELEQAQKAAQADGKKIMVFVEAEWCGICRQMENEVFPDETIRKLIQEKYHPVTIDVDSREGVRFNNQEMTEREFARKMNVSATPTFIFIDSHGEVVAHQVGYSPVDSFETLLTFIHSEEFGKISLEEYRNTRKDN